MADIRHSLVIAASPDRVRTLVSTADGLKSWWAEDVVAAGAAVGLRFFNGTTTYRLVPQTQQDGVRWTCETGNEWAGTDIVFRLQPRGAQTLVEFSHERWASETPYFTSCNTVWGHLMFKLKLAVEHPAVARPLFTTSGMESGAGAVY